MAGPLVLDAAMAGLRRYSLIGPPQPDGLVSVHRLVQDVTLAHLPDGQTVTGWRRRRCRAPDGSCSGRHHGHGGVAAVPAADPARHRSRRTTVDTDPGTWHDGIGASGDYATARALWTTLAAAHVEQLGPEHPETLGAQSSLARWTGEAGDAVAARDLYAVLLPVRERVQGREHPDTLTARECLARWTGYTGDVVAARDLFAGLVPVRERVSGPEHPQTLTDRANHARWTG